MKQLVLQGTEEALGHGIVIAIPLAAHANRHAERRQALPVREAAVLSPLIGVMQQARPEPALGHCHRQGIEGEMLIGSRAHRPADDSVGAQIQQHRDIQPAGARRDRREIPDPDRVEGRRDEALLQEIRGRGRELMMLDDEPEPAHPPGFQAMHGPQSRHARQSLPAPYRSRVC